MRTAAIRHHRVLQMGSTWSRIPQRDRSLSPCCGRDGTILVIPLLWLGQDVLSLDTSNYICSAANVRATLPILQYQQHSICKQTTRRSTEAAVILRKSRNLGQIDITIVNLNYHSKTHASRDSGGSSPHVNQYFQYMFTTGRPITIRRFSLTLVWPCGVNVKGAHTPEEDNGNSILSQLPSRDFVPNTFMVGG